MDKEIIVVKQLPVIVEQLQTIKADVTERTSKAKSLVCTEDTVKEIKVIRAELNKEFKEWEERRKEVKRAIISPYEQFEMIYKECVTDIFKEADEQLKAKIDSVENELKEKKAADVKDYFEELCVAAGIDFLTFEMANINVTLSASLKSLKTQAAQFVGRVDDDLKLIAVQEHKDEVLFHYKKVDGFSFLNASKSITFVAEKYKAIELEKAKEEERKAKIEAEQKAAEKVDTVVETLTPPTAEPIAPPIEEEKILTLRFSVKGTLTQLRTLKEYLIKNNYDFEGE